MSENKNEPKEQLPEPKLYRMKVTLGEEKFYEREQKTTETGKTYWRSAFWTKNIRVKNLDNKPFILATREKAKIEKLRPFGTAIITVKSRKHPREMKEWDAFWSWEITELVKQLELEEL